MTAAPGVAPGRRTTKRKNGKENAVRQPGNGRKTAGIQKKEGGKLKRKEQVEQEERKVGCKKAMS